MNKKRIALAITIERRKERKQFCAFSAHARFHTAWVKSGKPLTEHMFSALLPLTDIAQRGSSVVKLSFGKDDSPQMPSFSGAHRPGPMSQHCEFQFSGTIY
jgi:hypothetical protein